MTSQKISEPSAPPLPDNFPDIFLSKSSAYPSLSIWKDNAFREVDLEGQSDKNVDVKASNSSSSKKLNKVLKVIWISSALLLFVTFITILGILFVKNVF